MASNPSVLKQHRQCKYYFISYLFCFQLWTRENIESHSFLRVFYCRKMSGRFTLTDDQFCEYRRQLSLKQEDNFFQLDWGWGVVRNCDKKGNLLKPGLKRDFMKSGKSLWIPLQLCLFSDSEGVFGIWACGQCMPEVKGLSFQQQDRCVIESEICHHSRAILQLGENFRSRYKNELPSDINSFDGTNNACLFYPHRKTAIMRSDPDPSGMCLVGYQNNGKVSLLYTTSSKNKIPLCSQCRGDDCLCYKAFMEGCKKGFF